MPQIQIMIVDDSIVVRKVLSDLLSRDPNLKVAGWASNGRLALAKLRTLHPDVILLDIEMPEMNGLETIPEIRKLLPRVPIIMFSTLTESGAKATLDALELGATDYVCKPSNADGSATAESIELELIPKIKAVCRFSPSWNISSPALRPAVPAVSPTIPARLKPSRIGRIEIVAIGVSTGGPDALSKILPKIPAGFPLPVVIAQHMPPTFTTMLADRLSSKCAVPVRECASGDLVEPGKIWIAPGNYHMVVKKEKNRVVLRTHQGPRENFCRPSVDVLFRSVAEVYGDRALAIILTGMGQDGLKGCEELYKADAPILVQDEASSVVWGMPGFVARAGLAEKVLPLAQIGEEINYRATLFSLMEVGR